MKDKKKNKSKMAHIFSKIAPYVLVFGAIITLMALGSQKDQQTIASSPIITALNDSDFVVTADQLSESYIVAEVANTFSLPTVASINENYASIVMKYAMSGSLESGVIEKPNIIDTSNLSRGIISYIVKAGDSLATIASYYGVTTTQIRWSNNMKNDTIAVDQRLYIPSVPGILYTAKEGETLEGIAEKYKSDVGEIIHLNDLETSGLIVGKTIILPNGELPEKERPEYVAPVVRPVYTSNLRDSGTRHNMQEIGSYAYWQSMFYSTRGDGNPGSFGQCTWFAWHWRRYNMPENYWLPGGMIGNAGTWTYMPWSSQFIVNKTPGYGAAVQTSTGSPGHVAVVTGVVEGEYILIREMNYSGYNGKLNHVYESRINWADALKYNYIHGRR